MTGNTAVFTIENGVLHISGESINTALPVAEAVFLDGNVIARLDVPTGTVRNDNVVCFDLDGEELWTAERSSGGGRADNPYVSLAVNDTDRVLVETFDGIKYEINKSDGTVSPLELRRF